MPLTIGTNVLSLRAIRQMDRNGEALSTTFERLSSGQRINRASDDAAGLAIAENLRAHSRVYSQSLRNINDGLSLLNTTDGALTALTDIVTRQKELAEQAANGTYGFKQRAALNQEAAALTAEYNRIVESTTFNGISLFGTEAATTGIRLQHGYGVDQSTVNTSITELGHFAGAATFNAGVSYSLGTSFVAVEATDVNNDGTADLLLANGTDVQVRLGIGDGSFAAALTITNASGISSRTLQTGDFNGDGEIDLVAGDAATNTMILFAGKGDGTFVQYSTFGSGYLGFEAADLNNDGNLDLVGWKSGQLNVLLNQGNGTFYISATMPGGNGVNDVDIGDINGDGIPDLLYALPNERAATSFGRGDGTFLSAVTIGTHSSNYSLALGDFNGDGSLDVATQSHAYLGAVRVNLNDGSGNLGAYTQYTVGGQVQATTALHVTDINDDGIDDIMAANWNGYAVSTLLGNSSGTLTAGATLSWPGSTFPLAVTSADFNNDGIEDVAATSSNIRGFAVFTQEADTTRFIATVDELDLSTIAGAKAALIETSSRLERIGTVRGSIGALQSRLGTVANNLQSTIENYEAARSRIVDSDIAQEAAELARLQILRQAGAAVLAQTNLQPQLALELLRK